MARIRAIVLLGLWFSAIGIIAPFIITLGVITRNENFIYGPVRFFVRLGVRLVSVRVQVCGLENLNPKQAYVLTPNHQSVIEVPLLVTYLGRNPAFLAKKELFKFPVFGQGIRAIKVVPVDRRDRQSALRSAHLAAENLRKGKTYVVYPEGTRSPDGHLLPFKKGAFMMAIEAGVPIVPITVSGSSTIMPKNKIKVFPGTIHIIVHPPIDTRGYSKENVADLVERTRSLVMSRLSEQEIAGLASSKASGR
jgi:1-acyl-sn-glycerol-3-phosphate acyltransferase